MSSTASRSEVHSTSQNVTIPVIPELYNPNFLDILLPATAKDKSDSVAMDVDGPRVPTNPMMDALRATANHALTTNGAEAFSSTLSVTLDAFFRVAHNPTADDVDDLLTNAWAESPELTLRIIWNVRSIHDGKGEKDTFYQCFGWLYNTHPRTAIANLHLLVAPVCVRKEGVPGQCHGYWKDLLNIVVLAAGGHLGPDAKGKLAIPRKRWQYRSDEYWEEKKMQRARETRRQKEARRARAVQAQLDEQARAKWTRVARDEQFHRELLQNLEQPKFRALYVAVARLFVAALEKDIRVLGEIKALPQGADRLPLIKKLSLAGKWAPTPGLFHDRRTNLTTAIALLLHQSGALAKLSVPASPSVSLSSDDSHTLRSFFQRWVLTEIRRVTLLPEPLMSARQWSRIPYSWVASLSMQRNMEQFATRDAERFEQYLKDVEGGKKSISGATLMPHEIVYQICVNSVVEGDDRQPRLKALREKIADMHVRTAEAQWKTLLERMRESGKLDNCLAVCDVSGSMGNIKYPPEHPKDISPIYPSVGLSILLAQLASPPFANGFITFSHRPQFVQFDPSKRLSDIIRDVVAADWSMNTNFEAVFLKLLLPLAVEHAVKPDDMIRRLFVFSDMQFDAANGTPHTEIRSAAEWETTHDRIVRAYADAGYAVPEIVYWNLEDGADGAAATAPVTQNQPGVALLSGFSPSMLKVFMGEEEEDAEEEEDWQEVSADGKQIAEAKARVPREKKKLTPEDIMKRVLERPSFDGLVVLD